MSTRSAVRTSWSSTVPHSDCMPTARSRSSFRRSASRSRPCAGSARGNGWRCIEGPVAKLQEADQDDYCACVLGLRDYVDKNGFKGVVLGLSGGIDSALVAAMAVDALGAERVRCVMLPYRFTSQVSLDDAAATARRSAFNTTWCRSKPPSWSRRGAGAVVRRAGARRHRGESAGAGARHHPDGDLQQVRPDGGDHRQQVGNVGRLRHALRRHERRLQPDQGSLQDRGLPAGAPAQPLAAGRRARGPTDW